MEASVRVMGQQALAAQRAYEREDDLALALAACDAAAWRQLFEEQYQRVYNYAYLRTGNRGDAEDIASTTFSEAVAGIRRFRYRGTPVVAWLLGIAHHETADVLKRRARRDALHVAGSVDAARAPDALFAAAQRRELGDALRTLNADQRNVVVLRLVEGRSVAEVAALLHKSEGAVKVTQMRALRKLRSVLEPAT